jgi:hypothetical protein
MIRIVQYVDPVVKMDAAQQHRVNNIQMVIIVKHILPN